MDNETLIGKRIIYIDPDSIYYHERIAIIDYSNKLGWFGQFIDCGGWCKLDIVDGKIPSPWKLIKMRFIYTAIF